MKVTFVLTFLVLLVLVTNSFGWLWRRRNRCGTWFRHRPCTASKCSDPSRGKPFYFGTTRLFCMAKGKRGSSPSRPTWALKHRWIEYNGHYFERLKNGGDIFSSNAPKDSNKCSSRRESRPAGYSSLSIDCLKRCTNKYRQRYGSYRLLSNNCHHFANRFSDILCSRTTCPSWCS
ncbi:unnamed protein product [Mytilus coruscus]|uniref:LRAT domain-containing protein n=1 Tax=Mytilus coruscus TaxID=42192 RepID=A0A6J8AXC4_MYTCO|nr:unnamed protein product [Mytilus coruscus]